MRSLNTPALQGGLLAFLAATLFGISTPLVQRMGAGVGAFSTAALLYAGAAWVGALMRQPAEREAALHKQDWRRIGWMALFGAGLGPVAMAWGLQHTSGTSASLMLTLEAVFTALLARSLYGEVMDHRVWGAMALLFAGGIVLILDRGAGGSNELLGALAVLAATLSWGIDNTLSRGVADRDPGQVVLAKSALGVALTCVSAWVMREPWPDWPATLGLLLIGATGYGLSLKLYLLAQRAFGAARTGSVFAFAPFIGAVLAVALGDRSMSWGVVLGGSLMLLGVILHLVESHGHEHVHEELVHEHAHVHDDGHHTHVHDPMPQEAHSHPHRHEPIRHAHAHVPDAHHTHRH
ncbi:MAG: EamA family transporter [Proteobacteria bacterium]|uniref:DMT family transporter n=1 Tax=Aquabacterium sp. TaxID=1872578 RepID=UPI0035C67252|nr:EamA family transporter [Pseudomonadota bacterium]